MTGETLVTPTTKTEDKTLDLTLRPRTLPEYVGQDKLKANLNISIQAARKRNEPIEHVILHGPPGLGKTTLAHIIAQEMAVNIRITSGPAIERAGDLAAILTNLQERDILFIDEIHRLNRVIEEVLYPAMEEYRLDIIIGKGPSAQTLRIDLPRFTLIGATTRVSLLSSPLRDRFGLNFRFDFYTDEDITKIVRRSAKILGVTLDDAAAAIIAQRSRQTPRVANRLLKRVRDFSQVSGDGSVSTPVAEKALAMLDIDEFGLDTTDRKILEVIIEKFGGGPVGVHSVAAAISEETETIEDVYEPFLMQAGFLVRTPRGRSATEAAYRHMKKKTPSNLQARIA